MAMTDSSQNSLSWIDDELAKLESQHLRRRLQTRSGRQAAEIEIDGQRLVNFGSNDYLGLASDPRLASAAVAACEKFGWGSGASPLITGYSELHQQLETRLAEFMGREAALVFTSGFAANVGTIATLASRDDAIFADAKNHASLIDGCRLSRAAIHVYPHADIDRLAQMLRDSRPTGRRLIVTDSLFSMDGDLAPLDRLAELADQYGAMLMVDEAHAVGVFGTQGRGVAEYLGVADRVDIGTATLSKAFGCAGGFVVGSQSLIDWLANRARSYVFSTAHPPATYAAVLAALEIIEGEPARRTRLLDAAAQLRETLAAQGWRVGPSASQIIPIVLGEPEATMQTSAALRTRGLFVPGIRPPTVPAGESLLRISLSYAHSTEMLARLVEALAEIKPR
jgi:8-amino-7-oxononanoate synthase